MTTLNEIKGLIKNGSYDEALAACDAILAAEPDSLPDVCRLRSWLFTRQGNYGAGVDELLRIIECGKATIGDYHSAAMWSLFDGQLAKAHDWFAIVLEQSQKENEDWFKSSTMFYLAFIYMELKDYQRAAAMLNLAGDTDEERLVLLPQIGACSRKQLRQEIKRRASRK